ncbi:SEC14-like protein [Seminavis robusta]|uniref:SEC14-like protein n=1 Tax=Seminavis robusta TaxID=568900 RepID=A0A9N8EGE8_9STRA|nr:SEC14-like protein [Seminavis robusta]|eukprot:Sro1058_g236360.1 SEC14-like protein (423) ;mRNA; r:9781-11049
MKLIEKHRKVAPSSSNASNETGRSHNEKGSKHGSASTSSGEEELKNSDDCTLDSKILQSWSEGKLQAIAKRWKLTKEEQSKLKELQPRLADVRHEKNDPEEVVPFLKETHSVKSTELRFRKFIDFRIKQVDTILQDYHPHPVMKSHFPITLLNGFDKEGDGIWLERTGATDSLALYRRFGKAEMMRYQLWTRENAVHTPWCQAYKAGKKQSPRVTCIMDMQGLNCSHMHPALLPVLADVINIVQNYYCGFIKKIIVVREPAIFKVIWNLVKHFFNQTMKDLIVFSGPNNYLDVLGDYIDDLEETLPPCLMEGGRGTMAEGMPQRMDGGTLPPKKMATKKFKGEQRGLREEEPPCPKSISSSFGSSDSMTSSGLYVLPTVHETVSIDRGLSLCRSCQDQAIQFDPNGRDPMQVRCRIVASGTF